VPYMPWALVNLTMLDAIRSNSWGAGTLKCVSGMGKSSISLLACTQVQVLECPLLPPRHDSDNEHSSIWFLVRRLGSFSKHRPNNLDHALLIFRCPSACCNRTHRQATSRVRYVLYRVCWRLIAPTVPQGLWKRPD
jgi:hypothetical protein